MKTLKPLEMVRVAITPFCDLRCEHCYAANISLNQMIGYEREQLSMEQIENFLLGLKKTQNLNRISITGGEALTQQAWPRSKALLKFALDNDLVVQINTSGSDTVTIKDIYEVTGDKFNKIVFHISLDHVDAEWVNTFRGKENAYDRSVTMIKDVVKYGGYSEVRYTITSGNYIVTPECYKMVSELGASCFVAKVVFPTGSVYNHEYLKLDEEIVAQVQKRLIELSVNNKTSVMLPSPVFCDREKLLDNANVNITECSCGDTSLYLSFNGDLLPCPYLQGSEYYQDIKIGNITDPGFDFDKLWSAPTTFMAHRNTGSFECATYKVMAGEIKAE